MQYAIVGLLLDGDGRQLARGMVALVAAVLMALLLAVAIPVAFLGGVAGRGSELGGSSAGGSGVAASDVGGWGVAAQAGAPRPGSSSLTVIPPASAGGQLVDVARRYLGVAYVFGGSNPATGLDCSGLVQLVFRQLGISLPRTAQLQYAATQRVAQDELQPGDLVFFARTYADPHDWITHVGIYIGGGMQINAPTEGQVVSIQPVFSGFWGAHYAGAGRARGA
ncbi:MAG: C40 family peptidase [Chloroflexota bacterium]|nr:C40 family peptidase [Chloroflexota bacterium]